MKLRLFGLLTTTIAFFVLLDEGRAQENLPPGPSNYEQDLQIFAPFELDLDNMTDKQWSGYFFEYNKLFWAYTGERVTVGSPNVFVNVNGVQVNGEFAEIIYRTNPQDEGAPPDPYVVQNTLNNVPPKAGFALGNRYEFGYQDQGHGWTIGVLDGPRLNQTEFYGFVKQDTNDDGILDGYPPFKDTDYTNSTDIADAGGQFGQSNGPTAGGDLRTFGFGSVPIVFETPPGYLYGFRDYLNFLGVPHLARREAQSYTSEITAPVRKTIPSRLNFFAWPTTSMRMESPVRALF